MALYKAGVLRNISLNELKPDKENFRFDPVDSIEDAIDVMIDDQKTSLCCLAEDIVKNGLSPSDLVMVVQQDGSREYTVIDGNRRVISLIALMDPSFIPASLPTLRQRFEGLRKKHPEVTDKETVRCVVFPDKDAAKYWIEKEHIGIDDGRGKDDWDPLQKDRFIASFGQKPMAYSAWEFAKKGASEDVQRLMHKPKFYSTFERIVQSKPGRAAMGISEIKVDGTVVCENSETAREMLRVVIKDFGAEGLDVNKVRKAGEIKSYMSGVRVRVTGEETPKQKKNTRCAKHPRSTVIPKKCDIPISEKKIKEIFDELRNLNVENYRFATSFLLRSLLELSMEKYVMATPAFACTLAEKEKREKLYYRLVKFFEYAEKGLSIRRKHLVPYKKATLENKHVPLTEELNSYVHNLESYPNPKDLINTWDNIEGLVRLIWKEIVASETKTI